MSFGDRLRASRKERGFSQEQLAEELEVSRQSVTKWETGVTFPEIKTMLRLASVLERDLDWLLYDEKQNSKVSPCLRSHPRNMEVIPDRNALNSIIKQDLVLSLLNTLDGYEIIRRIETAEFTGTQTCIFYNGRVFAETTGYETLTNEPICSFSEMSLPDIEALLLPWDAVRRSIIKTQPEVAENER